MTDPNGAQAVERRGGSFAQALANGQRLLAEHPAVALEQAQTLLTAGPEPRALRLAAAACRRLGRGEDAEHAELAAIEAGLRVPVLNEAAIAGAEGRSADAGAILERFLGDHPDDLLALTMAAEVDLDSWRIGRAEQRLRIVLERAPGFLRAAMLRARALVVQARIREAIELLEGVERRNAGNRTALQMLAQLYAEANDHERAAATYAKILELQPNDDSLWTILAQHLRILGRADDSQAAFRHAISLNPGNGAAWWGLTNYFAPAVTEADAAAMEQALGAHSDSPRDGGPLHIALAIVAEGRGNHAEAFKHLAAGKRLRLEAHPYDPDVLTAEVDALIATFPSGRFAAKRADEAADEPIFIIGMPRSGTTLVERILGQHSQVEAAGELPIMPRLLERLRREAVGSFAERLAAMGEDELRQLGQWYVERSRDYRTTGKARFVDKLNINWLHSSLIRAMLPKARIIDVRRDPLDCCWANFRMLFADGHRAANDQRHIARFYRDYDRLVTALDAAAPGAILTVRYEDVVGDVEAATRRMLDFLGLDYEPECIEFHRSTGAVATPSSEQVRRPINRDSIDAAQPYRRWLGPMIDELGGLARGS